jgi:hypothetical protein
MKKYIANSLFQSGPNKALNACVGDNGGPYDFNDMEKVSLKADTK